MTEALLAGITRKPRTKAGLIIGLDATASREHCWDIASQLQSEMFQAAAGAGGLDAQLVYYRGLAKFGGECKASPWTDNPAVLVKLMSKIRCQSGVTQIGAASLFRPPGNWLGLAFPHSCFWRAKIRPRGRSSRRSRGRQVAPLATLTKTARAGWPIC